MFSRRKLFGFLGFAPVAALSATSPVSICGTAKPLAAAPLTPSESGYVSLDVACGDTDKAYRRIGASDWQALRAFQLEAAASTKSMEEFGKLADKLEPKPVTIPHHRHRNGCEVVHGSVRMRLPLLFN